MTDEDLNRARFTGSQRSLGIPSAKDQNLMAASSWNIGSFHPTSRFFTSYLKNKSEQNLGSQKPSLLGKQEAKIGRDDICRVLKENKEIEHNLKKMMLNQYGNCEINQNKLYMIDKVVRKRINQKPFGLDYSEFINLKLEDYQNKEGNLSKLSQNQGKSSSMAAPGTNISGGAGTKENAKESHTYDDESLEKDKDFNARFMERLSMGIDNSESQKERDSRRNLTFEEWVRRKNSEQRLKNHLIQIEKQEIEKAEQMKLQEKMMKEEQAYEIILIT